MTDYLKNKGILELRVKGKDPEIWKRLRGKLVDKLEKAVDKLMDQVIDPVNGTTLEEESKQVVSLGLNHIKSTLAKQGINNEKTIAEIKDFYAKLEERASNKRKIDAEAEALEFKNFVNKLKFSLGATKIMLLDDNDEEAVLFVKRIDAWIELINSFQVG